MHLDEFVTEIRSARRSCDLTAARDVVAEAVRAAPLAGEVGDPHSSQLLYTEAGLLVLHVVVLPGYATAPHDHRTWSLVGIYSGREDNIFYQQLPQLTTIAQTGGRTLEPGETLVLDESAIHSIANSGTEPLVALHVYGANIFALDRRAWDAETGAQERYDFERHAGGRHLQLEGNTGRAMELA